MKIERKHLKAICFYTLYGVAATIFFLYFLFPGDMVRDYLVAGIMESQPGALVSIDAVTPVFPPGVKIGNITIGFKKNVDATLHADTVTIKPAIGKLFQGKTALSAMASTYGGTVATDIGFNKFLSFQGSSRTEVRIENVKIEKCTYLQDALNREVTGKLTASLTYQGMFANFMNGTGRIQFSLRNGIYALIEPLAGISSFNYKSVEGEATLSNGTLNVNRLELTADNARCTLKGQIVLEKNDFKNSQIALTGQIEVRGGLGNRKIPYTLSGSIANPQLTLQ